MKFQQACFALVGNILYQQGWALGWEICSFEVVEELTSKVMVQEINSFQINFFPPEFVLFIKNPSDNNNNWKEKTQAVVGVIMQAVKAKIDTLSQKIHRGSSQNWI